MPQLVKKRRSGWAVLAAGALVASLLAVGAAPVGADTDNPDHTTKLSACVGGALADQAFSDVVEEHAFRDNINCIAYYGITNGTGDGTTFSPNMDVTRAQMAVFIARAAGVAGVALGDAMSAGFTDIGDQWQEAQDAINRLGSKGIIPKGGEFRPGDDITRAEMATFLVGLLAKAAMNVTIDSAGKINLGTGGTAAPGDDYFADVRDALPRANDAEVTAIYELGITKGASAAAVQDDTKPPLDYNYEPAGTVNRGQMAAFITRALAHTSVRPAGISAQYDGTNVVVSARSDDFQPQSNVVVDIFRTDTDGVDLAFKADGSCGEVSKVSATGTYSCEIDNSDQLTRGDGDTSVALGDIDDGGTTVWAWTGDNEDTVDGDTTLFRLDVPEEAAASKATKVRVSTEFKGAKAHLGSSVLFTVQLEDAKGAVSNGADGEKPAKFLVTLSTTAIVNTTPAANTVTLGPDPQGASVVTTLPLTTDADGKATFSAAGLPDPDSSLKRDKYRVDIHIQAAPSGNAPADPSVGAGTSAFYLDDDTTAAQDDATGRVTVRSTEDDNDYTDDPNDLIFSTEASDKDEATVSVEPAAEYVVASARGASNRATVTVLDQYGDPVVGAEVSLASAGAGAITIGGGNAFAVGRDGSYQFGYERVAATPAAEELIASWDHDGDGCASASASDTPANPVNVSATCADLNGDGTADDPGTAPTTSLTAGVEWATVATTASNSTGSGQAILSIDTENNIIFTGTSGSVVMVSYDSNDRFDLTPSGVSQGNSSYAEFEKEITKADTLSWNITRSGSRGVNFFHLIKA